MAIEWIEASEVEEKKLTYAERKKLPDSAFAYVSGDVRQFPIHDAAHCRNALARMMQGKWGGVPPDKRMAVLKKVIAKAKKFGIEVSDDILKKAGIKSKENMEEDTMDLKELTPEELAEHPYVADLLKKIHEQEEPQEEEKPEEPEPEKPNEEVEALKKEIAKLREEVKKVTTEKAKPKGRITEKVEAFPLGTKSELKEDSFGGLYREPDYEYWRTLHATV